MNNNSESKPCVVFAGVQGDTHGADYRVIIDTMLDQLARVIAQHLEKTGETHKTKHFMVICDDKPIEIPSWLKAVAENIPVTFVHDDGPTELPSEVAA